jgi:predicted transcriptional regulator
MVTRRSQFEIYIDILKAVADGKQKPTHVMYRANLTWKRLKKHVDFLVAHGLLIEEKDGRTKILSITSSGKDVIWYHMKIERELVQTKKIMASKLYPSIITSLRK